ncbi:MAG TPA: iron-containing alcohol dehydrogenase PsrA [Burkholderiales bacterium]
MSGGYYNPVSIHTGAGSLKALQKLGAGKRVALITFPEARGLGLIDAVQALLPGQVGMVVEDVQPNPDVAQLAGLYARFWEKGCAHDLIVAIGGGSTIDTAKALMAGTASSQFEVLLSLLAEGRAFTPARVKPLIAIPTTAGTGSEVTPWATIWDAAKQKKYSLHLDCTWPTAAIIDPELHLSLPRGVTISTGLDALSHALESIWNVNANPVSDSFAVSAVEDVLQYLVPLAADLGNLELRERMALAALKAGMAFSNTKTALAHSISYDMTLRHGLPHGIACSFTLPFVLGMAWGRHAGRDAVLKRALGPDLASAQQRLRGLLHALNVKTGFSDYGVSQAEEQAMVSHAMEGPRGRNFIGVA